MSKVYYYTEHRGAGCWTRVGCVKKKNLHQHSRTSTVAQGLRCVASQQAVPGFKTQAGPLCEVCECS